MLDKRKKYTTEHGKEVTGEELDKLADDFASGKYEPTTFKKRGRPLLGSEPSDVIQVRMDPENIEKLKKLAKKANTTQSEIMRRAFAQYVEEENKTHETRKAG